jgi:hypothetical protein
MHSFNRRLLLVTTILTLTGFAGFATGQTLLPLNGQNAEQIKSDDMACQNQVTSATTPATEQPQGGRLAGAVKGGLVGAAAAEVRGNQYDAYDRLDEDVQQEYRQENARDAAAVGADRRSSPEKRSTCRASGRARGGHLVTGLYQLHAGQGLQCDAISVASLGMFV